MGNDVAREAAWRNGVGVAGRDRGSSSYGCTIRFLLIRKGIHVGIQMMVYYMRGSLSFFLSGSINFLQMYCMLVKKNLYKTNSALFCLEFNIIGIFTHPCVDRPFTEKK